MTKLRSATVAIHVAIVVPCFHPGCTAHEHEITPDMVRDAPAPNAPDLSGMTVSVPAPGTYTTVNAAEGSS